MKWSSSLRLKRESAVAQCLLSVPLVALSSLALAGSPIGSDPVWLGTMGNTLFFIAQPASSTPAGSAALFKSDGTTAGTTQVAGFTGSDSFTYTVKDVQGALSNVASVTLTVTAAASSSGGRGGGAATPLDLLALGGFALMRRFCPSIRAARAGSRKSRT